MKILIVADLHANIEAVSALPTDYDELFVLGDLVNYGPNPLEVIQYVRENATLVVRGDHDHAIGFETSSRCSPVFQTMAFEMGRVTQALLSDSDRAFLRSLPLTITTENHGHYFKLCHATPTHPLFAYCAPNADEWKQETLSRTGLPACRTYSSPVSTRNLRTHHCQSRQCRTVQERSSPSILCHMGGRAVDSAFGSLRV